MNIPQLLRENSEQNQNKPAIIFNDENITFSQLYEKVGNLASGLVSCGIGKSEKAAIYLPNCPQYIYSYLALFSIGAVVVPLDFMLTEEEVINFINHSDSNIVIVKGKKGVSLANIKKRCSALKKIVLLGENEEETLNADEFTSWNNLITQEADFPSIEINDKDYAAIFYTSGSTGHPKGVLLTYGHFDNPVKGIDHFLHPTDEDSYLCAGVPFSHIGGLDYMLFMLSFGSTLVLMDRFHPFEALKNIEKYKSTIFCIVPAMYVAILSLKECDRFDLSSLRYAVVFGAPSSPKLLMRFHKLCPNATLLNGWGMTETAAPNTYSPPDDSKLNSIGKFGIGMEAKIVDEEGKQLPEDIPGELWIKGEAIMVGYYKEPEMTQQSFSSDGWFKTGDIAKFDKDGLFYIVGRKKDMIKVGGQLVYASEVEGVLQKYDPIAEVAVIGVEDKLRGEALKAFIVLKEKDSVTSEDIKYFAREQAAHFKVPQIIVFKDSLPKNRTGKIDKESLKQELVPTSQ